MPASVADSRRILLQPGELRSRLRVCTRSFQKAIFQGAALPDGLQGVLLDENAFDDNSHMGAKLFDDLQHVRSKKNRRSSADKAGEQVADYPRRHRIHSLERFVQKKEIR